MSSTPDPVDAYVAGFPPEVAERLSKLRHVINSNFDGATETIRYGMPAVMLSARHGLHFAGWSKHIALYPVPRLAEPSESSVARYRSGKDTVKFLHTEDIPYDLVGPICDAIAARATAG